MLMELAANRISGFGSRGRVMVHRSGIWRLGRFLKDAGPETCVVACRMARRSSRSGRSCSCFLSPRIAEMGCWLGMSSKTSCRKMKCHCRVLFCALSEICFLDWPVPKLIVLTGFRVLDENGRK